MKSNETRLWNGPHGLDEWESGRKEHRDQQDTGLTVMVCCGLFMVGLPVLLYWVEQFQMAVFH